MGQPAARVGDSVFTGHGCTTTTKIVSGLDQGRVIIEGEPAAVVGMEMEAHTINNPAITPPCISHIGPVVNAGSATVLVGGKPLARTGDSADMGAITGGASKVLAG